MKREIEYLEFVYKDIDDATDWYAKIDFKLSDELYAEFQNKISVIINEPLHFQKRFGEIRISHLKRFPYSIHFYIKERTIFIVGFIHQHRNPKLALKRLEK